MNISIIGYGRFGETLLKLLGDEFEIGVFTRSEQNRKRIPKRKNVKILKSEDEIYKYDTIFYCVPISTFESVLSAHSPLIKDSHTLIDVLSVKVHPKNVFEKYLKDKKTQAILTHPMFGPDSSKNGFNGLPVMIDKFKASRETYLYWTNYLKSRGLKVEEMTADEHDHQAANSHGLTHFIGRLLQEYGFKPSEIDTVGATKLNEIMDQVCNDTWELYLDLERYNPYTKEMVKKLDASFELLHKKTFNK